MNIIEMELDLKPVNTLDNDELIAAVGNLHMVKTLTPEGDPKIDGYYALLVTELKRRLEPSAKVQERLTAASKMLRKLGYFEIEDIKPIIGGTP